MGLSEETIEVCKQHDKGYKASINGCGKCPINSSCIAQKPTRTFAEQEEWRAGINKAAAEWMANQARGETE